MTEQSHTGGAGLPRQLLAGVSVWGSMVLLGGLLGLLWWVIAPRSEGASMGDGEVFTGTTEAVFAAEGYFLIMTVLAGLVTGYAVYMIQFPLARRQFQDLRLTCLIAGVLGAATAALAVWWLGTTLDGSLHESVANAEPGEPVTAGLQLQATAFLVAWPFVFVLQYGLLDAISLVRRDSPGVPDRAPEPDPDEAALAEPPEDTAR